MGEALRCLAGHLYRPGEGFSEGWVVHDGARVVESGEGKPPRAPQAEGVVLPAPVNAHTHMGDAVGRGGDWRGMTLAQVVAPPDGLKHRILRETPLPERLDAMRRALAEMAARGTRRFIDFREQGVDGARLLRRACEDLPVEPVILGRPLGAWDDEEAARVLEVADGFGLSALADMPGDEPERMAALAHRLGKRIALHLSEGRHEDVARALDLRPDFLVHLVHATRDDLDAIASAGAPVVVCPRSNLLFGGLPPVASMLEAGISVAFGSDNAMFHEANVLADAHVLLRHHPELSRSALLDALVVGGRRAARDPVPRDFFAKGEPADLVVLAGTPERALTDPPRVLHVTTQVFP